MLFRLRQTQGKHFLSGNWIGADGQATELPSSAIEMTPTAMTEVADRKLPASWRIVIPDRHLKIDTVPLNPRSWMGTSLPYWEGPISFTGSHKGVGYLEMTGY
jgi:predicted secreted hydrolase